MQTKLSWRFFAVLAGALTTASAQAHHSSTMFNLQEAIWVEGAVVRFDRINPHSLITLEETTKDGRTVQWKVEGPALFQLDQRGVNPDFLKAGDVIGFCSFALNEKSSSRVSAERASSPSSRFVHGHVLIMADGEKRLWGSYGNLAECIRSSGDEEEPWVEFLSAESRVRERWCGQRQWQKRTAPESTAFVDELNGLLADPCK